MEKEFFVDVPRCVAAILIGRFLYVYFNLYYPVYTCLVMGVYLILISFLCEPKERSYYD